MCLLRLEVHTCRTMASMTGRHSDLNQQPYPAAQLACLRRLLRSHYQSQYKLRQPSPCPRYVPCQSSFSSAQSQQAPRQTPMTPTFSRPSPRTEPRTAHGGARPAAGKRLLLDAIFNPFPLQRARWPMTMMQVGYVAASVASEHEVMLALSMNVMVNNALLSMPLCVNTQNSPNRRLTRATASHFPRSVKKSSPASVAARIAGPHTAC